MLFALYVSGAMCQVRYLSVLPCVKYITCPWCHVLSVLPVHGATVVLFASRV